MVQCAFMKCFFFFYRSPLILDDEPAWENKKRQYVHLVTMHLNEKSKGRGMNFLKIFVDL